MLSDKQAEVLKSIINSYNEYHGTTFRNVPDFIRKVYNKEVYHLNEITNRDVNDIIRDSKRYCRASDAQVRLVNRITNKKHKNMHLMCSDVSDIVQKAKEDGCFIAKRIWFNNLEYNIQYRGTDYMTGIQIHKADGAKTIKFIVFDDMMVLDWDTKDKEWIVSKLEKYPYTFLLYETKNGYHGYCVSKRFNHEDQGTLDLMNELGCDEYYTSFCLRTGFVVRTSKKQNRDEAFIERFVQEINTYEKLPRLLQLVRVKDSLVESNT